MEQSVTDSKPVPAVDWETPQPPSCHGYVLTLIEHSNVNGVENSSFGIKIKRCKHGFHWRALLKNVAVCCLETQCSDVSYITSKQGNVIV